MKSNELMKLAEDGLIQVGSVIIDQEKNEFVFTGKMFQLLDRDKAVAGRLYGLCVNDNWIITDEIAEK